MSAQPDQPGRTIDPGGPGHDLLRRVIRIRADQSFIAAITLINNDRWRIVLRDTGPNGTPVTTTDRAIAIHVLWARDDNTAALRVGGNEIALAPGDTITLPAGIAWSAASGVILCEIAGPHHPPPGAEGATMIQATHGEETFHGYNRQTTYPAPPGLVIERWKLTQPLALQTTTSPYVIVDLTNPLALNWPGGTDLIGRGECRLIPPGTGPVTLIPNGLGYALIVRLADAVIRNPDGPLRMV